MTTSIRRNSSNIFRRGTATIHAGFRLFVEKTGGCVSPVFSLTTNKEIHIYMFIRRIGFKAFIHAGLPRRKRFDELRRIELFSTNRDFNSSKTSKCFDELKRCFLCTT